jgi:hypothetical protein
MINFTDLGLDKVENIWVKTLKDNKTWSEIQTVVCDVVGDKAARHLSGGFALCGRPQHPSSQRLL